jgi:hypothetical protein
MAVTPSAPPRVPPAAPTPSYPAPPGPDPAPAPFFNGLQGYERYARWALESIAAMRGFHELIAREMDGVCLPTPDGLAIGIER